MTAAETDTRVPERRGPQGLLQHVLLYMLWVMNSVLLVGLPLWGLDIVLGVLLPSYEAGSEPDQGTRFLDGVFVVSIYIVPLVAYYVYRRDGVGAGLVRTLTAWGGFVFGGIIVVMTLGIVLLVPAVGRSVLGLFALKKIL